MVQKFRRFIETIVFHPILFSIYPVLFLYSNNIAMLKFQEILRSTGIAIAVVTIPFFVFSFFLKDAKRGGLLVSFLLISFLSIKQFVKFVFTLSLKPFNFPVQISITFLGTLFILILVFIIFAKKRAPMLTTFANLISLNLFIFSLIAIVSFDLKSIFIKSPKVNTPNVSEIVVSQTSQSQTMRYKPDVYFIILDSYARSDVLTELYDLDNHYFLDFLREKGFYVAEKSHASYAWTMLSLTSTMNLKYLDELTTIDPDLKEITYVQDYFKNNNFMNFMKQQGYQIISFDIGVEVFNFRNVDEIALQKNLINRFEQILIDQYSLNLLLPEKFLLMNYTQRMFNQFDQLEKTIDKSSPKLVYAHFMTPHTPFVVDRNGKEVLTGNLLYTAGYNFEGSLEEYQRGYNEQLLYTNQRIEKAIEIILDRPGPKPIIILQSDHGGGMKLEDNPSTSCYWERMSILNAVYFPGHSQQKFYPEITPINTLALMLDTYFGTDIGKIEQKYYYSSYDEPFKFYQIPENQLDQPCQTERDADRTTGGTFQNIP